MSNTSARQTSRALAELRHVAATATGSQQSAARRLLAKLEAAEPQEYASEAHAALACWRCWRLPCVCGTPKAPTFGDILTVQQRRRGTR